MKENFSLRIGTMRDVFELNENKAPKNLREVYVSDEYGHLVLTEKYHQGNLVSAISDDGLEKWKFFYNSQGKLFKRIENGAIVLYFYNANGTLLSNVNVSNDIITKYCHIDNKVVFEHTYSASSGERLWQTDYNYATNGNMIYQCQYGNDYHGKWSTLDETWFLYNNANFLVYEKTEGFEERYEYDEEGKLVLVRIKDDFWQEEIEKRIHYNDFGFVNVIEVDGKVDCYFDYLFED